MIKRFTITILICILSEILFSQDFNITGQVVDANGVGIGDVEIQIFNITGQMMGSVKSDYSGNFIFNWIDYAAGLYILRCEHELFPSGITAKIGVYEGGQEPNPLIISANIHTQPISSYLTVDNAQKRLSTLKDKIITREKLVKEKITDLKRIDPLFADQDVFENDVDFINRLFEAEFIANFILRSATEDLRRELELLLHQRITVEIDLDFSKRLYDANTGVWKILGHMNNQYFEDRINISGKDAQYIYKNKNNLEISGFVNISYDGKIILNSIQVYDSFADVSFPPFLLSLKERNAPGKSRSADECENCEERIKRFRNKLSAGISSWLYDSSKDRIYLGTRRTTRDHGYSGELAVIDQNKLTILVQELPVTDILKLNHHDILLLSTKYNRPFYSRQFLGGVYVKHSKEIYEISGSPADSITINENLDLLAYNGGSASKIPLLKDSNMLLAKYEYLISHNSEKYLVDKSNKSVEKIASIPALPADLALDIQFTEPSGNNYLDAEETGTVSISITNNGRGEAYALQSKLDLKTSITGLITGEFELIEKLDPFSSKELQTTVSAFQNISSKTIEFEINVSEKNGFDLYPPGKLTIQTKALVPPALALMDVGINDLTNYNGRIEPNEVIEATAIIQNRGQGLAKNVNISVHYGDNVFNAGEAETSFSVGNVQSNETKEINFSFFATRKAETNLPIRLEIKEARGLYDQAVNAGLSLNEVIKKAAEVFVAGKEQSAVAITGVNAISVDIEKKIPKSKTVNKNALGVIFGIENYKNVSPVTFANRDAAFMVEYFEKILGISRNRIYYKTDSDVGQAEFSKVFSKDGWLDKRVKEGKTDLYIYYAGHGAPDIKKNKAYLIPYDGDPDYASQTGYEMDELYEQLGNLSARSTTVFLDACFTGANRESEILLAGARPVFMEVDASATRNVTVFSASSGSEISSAWPEKKHGLFSYFLMKGMRGDADTNKDKQITVGELGDYVKEHVSDMAGMLDREQTPGLQTLDEGKILIKY
jgi:hypothetical protein